MIGFESIIEACEKKMKQKFAVLNNEWHVTGEVFLRTEKDRLLVMESHPNGEEALIASIGMAAPKQLVESFANELSLFIRSAG
jgi:hypothetical protein